MGRSLSSLLLVTCWQLGLGGACVAGDAREALVIAMPEIRTELDPVHPRAIALPSYRILESVYDKLFVIDYARGGRLAPALALAIDQVDALTYDVALRPGVTFHDGTELTAADVAFTFGPQRMLRRDAPGHGVGRLALPTLAAVEAVGPYKVRFRTKAPDPVFAMRLASYGTGVVSARAFQAAPDFETWSRRPVATGPFKVARTRENGFIRLVAHDGYWQGRPPFRSLTFRAVSQLSARLAGLRAGDYDIVTTVTPDQLGAIARDARLSVVGGDTVHFRTLVYNTAGRPPMADARLRRALNLAIDRRLIVDTLWHGRIAVPPGFQNASFGQLIDPRRGPPAYDPAEARRLVAASSYRGEALVFRTVGNYYTAELATAQVLVEMWKAVGITVTLEVRENWAQVLDGGADIINSSAGSYYPDPLGSFWARWGPAGAWQRRGYWHNARFNALGEVLSTSLDATRRREAYHAMLRLWGETDPPGTVLHSLGAFFGTRADLDWRPTPTSLMDFRPQDGSNAS